MANCARCSTEYVSRTSNQSYCSLRCRELAGEQRWRDRKKAARPTVAASVLFACLGCGHDVFKPARGRSPKSPLCSPCRRNADRATHCRTHRERYPERAKVSNELQQKKRRLRSEVRLHQSVSGQIRSALNEKADGREWESLIGYTRVDLVRHLERQFQPEMSWANYGDWQIDHILPAASFKFSSVDDAEFVACWALSNLRPLWATENMSKGAVRLHLI